MKGKCFYVAHLAYSCLVRMCPEYNCFCERKKHTIWRIQCFDRCEKSGGVEKNGVYQSESLEATETVFQMLSCLVPPCFGQEDSIMPSSAKFALQCTYKTRWYSNWLLKRSLWSKLFYMTVICFVFCATLKQKNGDSFGRPQWEIFPMLSDEVNSL